MMPASLLDWLSTSLMFVGFATLLVLASYLVFALVARDGEHAPEGDLDFLTADEVATDARFEGWITPLAS